MSDLQFNGRKPFTGSNFYVLYCQNQVIGKFLFLFFQSLIESS